MKSAFAALIAVVSFSALSAAAQEQGLSTAPGGVLRALDKVSGETADIELAAGENTLYGRLRIVMRECRYPADDPSSNAYAFVQAGEDDEDEPQFSGWMIASAPALNALDNPRYDVWVLRCIVNTSSEETSDG